MILDSDCNEKRTLYPFTLLCLMTRSQMYEAGSFADMANVSVHHVLRSFTAGGQPLAQDFSTNRREGAAGFRLPEVLSYV